LGRVIDVVADVTVNVVLPGILPDVAVIVVEPAATAVASPEALMVAFDVSDEPHVTDAVMFFVLLSEYVPVAVNCCVVPVVTLGFAGVTATEASVAAVVPPPPPPPPQAASEIASIKQRTVANPL
jgi:hypothetical protein